MKQVVALKIQGLATHSYPQLLSPELIEIFRKYSKPLIIHTDYLNDFSNPNISEHLRKIMCLNDPLGWAQWTIQNNLRVYLAHGIRLDKDCARLVNTYEGLVVGIGPDLMIQQEPWRLKSKTKDYISFLLDLINHEKILFSTDFAWNFKDPLNEEILDWTTIERLKRHLSTELNGSNSLENILYQNAERFFRLSVKNVR